MIDAGRPRTVDEHGADHEVGLGQHLLDRERRGVDRRGAAAEDEVELAQARDRAVEDEHVGLHPDRDERGVEADDPAADDEHGRGGDAGHAAEQHPAPAERLLEHERAGLGRDLAGDLAHRREQRQPAVRVLDGLVGDARRAGRLQPGRELRRGREVQVREERLAGPQHRDLRRLRLLDLQHELGGGEDGGGVRDDPRALRDVVLVLDRAAGAGAGLDEHLVARAPSARGRRPASARRGTRPALISVGTPTITPQVSRYAVTVYAPITLNP